MKFVNTKQFRKALAKLSLLQQQTVQAGVEKYRENRKDPMLRDHPLKGKMKGLRSFSAGWDLRIIYREEDGFITIILIDAGTHNQVY